MAAGGHFGFWLLTNSAAIFARVMGAKVFLNTSKSSNQVSNLTMLSVVTGPPDCTQLGVELPRLPCVSRGVAAVPRQATDRYSVMTDLKISILKIPPARDPLLDSNYELYELYIWLYWIV